jgi:hypothetical protein
MSKLSLALFFTIVASAVFASSEGRCVFRIEALTERGGLRQTDEPYLGTSIALYEYPGGYIVGYRHVSWRSEDLRFGGGAEFTQRIRKVFREAALRDFDFEKSVADAEKKRGGHREPVFYSGFAELRFYADLEGTAFTFTSYAVRAKVEEYAAYSNELSRLKIVLDQIAYELGRLDEVAKGPNQSPEPTVMSVTPRAGARVAPATTVAHL